MRGLCAIAGLMAALAFGAAPARAFQETPVPPAEAPQATPQQPQAPALQLGTPGAAPAAPKAEQGGIKLFGRTLLPKLDFGLDVLYGQDQQQLQLEQGSTSLDQLDENGDVTVLGKVKRRF
jgi:hypothetical protein